MVGETRAQARRERRRRKQLLTNDCEGTGLSISRKIDRWSVDQALSDAAHWAARTAPPHRLPVVLVRAGWIPLVNAIHLSIRPLLASACGRGISCRGDATQNAGFEVTVVDVDDLLGGAASSLRRLKTEGEVLLYRGWMLSVGAYTALSAEVERRACTLLTKPEQYEAAHQLPSWYEDIAAFTPATVWTEGPSLDQLVSTTYSLKDSGPVVLKDYVKSEKHRWLEAAFVPDVAEVEHLRTVGAKLVEYRGAEFTGGFVIRDFESFTGPEVRTWWLNGQLAMTTAHPDTPNEVPDMGSLDELAASVASLQLPFITVDLIRRSDGQVRVVEIGDGQVSDRPSSADPGWFVQSLSAALAQP